MADNVTIPAQGTGTSTPIVATDERSIASATVHVQRFEEIGSSNIVATQVTCTNSSTTIVSARETRSRLILVNRQTVPVFIEMTTATTSDFRLDPGDSIMLYCTCEVDGITTSAYSASGDAKIHAIEEYD